MKILNSFYILSKNNFYLSIFTYNSVLLMSLLSISITLLETFVLCSTYERSASFFTCQDFFFLDLNLTVYKWNCKYLKFARNFTKAFLRIYFLKGNHHNELHHKNINLK